MKWFSRLPVLIRVILFLGICEFIVFVAQFVTGFIVFHDPVAINLLICGLVLLLTFCILRVEGLKREEAGLGQGMGRMIAGIGLGTAMLVSTAIVIRLIIGFHWQLNPSFAWARLPLIFITVFCSAFAQELAFRGYPFFLMLRKWGEWPAQLITAFLFGCMHLSGGMQWSDMLTVMLTTGAGSLLFGMATIRTRRIYLAAGIHFGWNLIQYLLPRSLGENGPGIWVVSAEAAAYPGLITYVMPYLIIVLGVYFILRIRPSAT